MADLLFVEALHLFAGQGHAGPVEIEEVDRLLDHHVGREHLGPAAGELQQVMSPDHLEDLPAQGLARGSDEGVQRPGDVREVCFGHDGPLSPPAMEGHARPAHQRHSASGCGHEWHRGAVEFGGLSHERERRPGSPRQWKALSPTPSP
ncbi:hypothetical protein [Nonomuraea zeae]|uniref:Uncharacterized protein n=1 Tax=Nonomuraea zeae TaxID=1642303 RepID=A0A5S4G0Z1_9ACTN|nr:hypothetical protein [Nonomuraea zeae]TMR26707.1 hypothetical protein ETD85_41535 [Nonomuraea zeae]